MRTTLLSICLLATIALYAQPVTSASGGKKGPALDWLVHPPTAKARIDKSADGKDVTLDNGLLSRTFRLQPNVACIDYKNLDNGQQLLRAVKPEARITIDGATYNIGGLY